MRDEKETQDLPLKLDKDANRLTSIMNKKSDETVIASDSFPIMEAL